MKKPTPPTTPNQRTFGLNDHEFYEAVCPPPDRPWIPNGALPREPRSRDPEAIIERSERKRRG